MHWCHLGIRRRRFWHATLRLHSNIRRHHPPQRAVLSQICCFGERKMVLFQILLDGAEHQHLVIRSAKFVRHVFSRLEVNIPFDTL